MDWQLRLGCNYKVSISIEKMLGCYAEPDNELDDLVVRLLYDESNGEDGEEESSWVEVGSARLTVARGYRRELMFESCDCRDQQLHEAWSALYDLETDEDGRSSEELRDLAPGVPGWEGYGGFILLDDVRIEEKHRGRRLGLLLVERALEIVEHDCAAVLTRAWPDGFHDMDPDELERQKAGLARYFALMGFEPFVDGFLVIKLGYVRPTIADLCKLSDERAKPRAVTPSPTSGAG